MDCFQEHDGVVGGVPHPEHAQHEGAEEPG